MQPCFHTAAYACRHLTGTHMFRSHKRAASPAKVEQISLAAVEQAIQDVLQNPKLAAAASGTKPREASIIPTPCLAQRCVFPKVHACTSMIH